MEAENSLQNLLARHGRVTDHSIARLQVEVREKERSLGQKDASIRKLESKLRAAENERREYLNHQERESSQKQATIDKLLAEVTRMNEELCSKNQKTEDLQHCIDAKDNELSQKAEMITGVNKMLLRCQEQPRIQAKMLEDLCLRVRV